ncbi:hypothetical protein RHS02_09328, partial [Rhizoctonia solani]
MFPKLSTALLILTAAASVSAHGALVAVAGSNGVNGQGFGVVDSTPRDGTRRNPFQVCFHTLARWSPNGAYTDISDPPPPKSRDVEM